jgi:hypothetical protein
MLSIRPLVIDGNMPKANPATVRITMGISIVPGGSLNFLLSFFWLKKAFTETGNR